MKTYFKKIQIVLMTIIILSSCNEDFLEKQPPGSASGDVMTSGRGVESILIGAYETLYGGGIFGGSLTDWEWSEISSDNAGFGAQNSFHAVESYSMLPNNSYPRDLWRSAYTGVARANDVLSFLQQTSEDISSQRAKEIEAEAKFIRAWQHFKLQRVFWQIPYIKTIEELGGEDPATIPNDSPVWDDIEADLQFCIDNLPQNHPRNEPGRPTQYAAMAVKARVHLFQDEFSQAKPLLDNIINSGRFSLVEKYYDNFRETTENNEESVFEIQCNVGDAFGQANTIRIQGACFHQNGPAGKGWGAYQPTQNLFEAYQVDENGLPILNADQRTPLAHDMGITSSQEFVPTDHPLDPRVDWTIARRGIPFLDWGIHAGASWIRSQFHGGPYMTIKFMHYLENDGTMTASGGFKNSRNFRAYRYAHVLLWRAEVAVEEGDLELARTLVNQVRERAQNEVVMGKCTTFTFDGRPVEVDYEQPAANYLVNPYPSGAEAFTNQENARKAVRLEMRLEFATEGHRFFDLRRWGIDNEVLNKFIEHDSQVRFFMRGLTYDPNINDHWPLPQDQLDLQSVLIQDPAYE
jgi:hypothetical protein